MRHLKASWQQRTGYIDGCLFDHSISPIQNRRMQAANQGWSPYCIAAGTFSVTSKIRFVPLWWISRLPSRVGLMYLTMPA